MFEDGEIIETKIAYVVVPENQAKAALAAIQEDYVLVRKTDLHTIILTTLVGFEGNIDETAKAIENDIITFSINKEDIKG